MLQVSSPCDLCLFQHEQPRMGNKGGSKSNNGCGKCKSNLLSYNLPFSLQKVLHFVILLKMQLSLVRLERLELPSKKSIIAYNL